MVRGFFGDVLDMFGDRKAAREAAEQLSADQTSAWNHYWNALLAVAERPEMQAFGLAAATGESPAKLQGDLAAAGQLRSVFESARVDAQQYFSVEELADMERHALDVLVGRVVADDGRIEQLEYGQVFALSLLVGADRMSPDSVARFQLGRVNAGFLPDPVDPRSLLLKRGEVCYFEADARLKAEKASREGGGVRQMKVVDEGWLSITDRRLVFTGTARGVEMRNNKLNAAMVNGPHLVLHRSDRVKPSLFEFPNANESLAAAILAEIAKS